MYPNHSTSAGTTLVIITESELMSNTVYSSDWKGGLRYTLCVPAAWPGGGVVEVIDRSVSSMPPQRPHVFLHTSSTSVPQHSVPQGQEATKTAHSLIGDAVCARVSSHAQAPQHTVDTAVLPIADVTAPSQPCSAISCSQLHWLPKVQSGWSAMVSSHASAADKAPSTATRERRCSIAGTAPGPRQGSARRGAPLKQREAA
mmetsp:Transcript_56388/g.160615  ORF Transcript_56388/g.160615 Transcript_56388/m.160615 type:complete len:201 (-) Transcript_56388:3-605(-)